LGVAASKEKGKNGLRKREDVLTPPCGGFATVGVVEPTDGQSADLGKSGGGETRPKLGDGKKNATTLP